MAGQITLWGAGELLNSFFSKTTELPDTFYLALVGLVPPSPYISGAELDEPEAASYTRVAIPNDNLTWSNDGQIQVMVCTADIQFVDATEDWGEVRYWALCNAPVDGNIYFIGQFEIPEVVDAGDVVDIAGGNLSISLGPFFTQEG